MNTSKCIVITGSIGCGKSSVCDILKKKGYPVIDADAISREIADSSIDEIEYVFGAKFIKNGKLDRQSLGAFIFKNKTEKEKLEHILHPKIKNAIFEKISELEQKNTLYFVDIPLFFESNNYKELSPVAVVYAPKEVMLKRIIGRDELDKIDAENRIAAQFDIEQKRGKADFIIDNSGSKDALDKNVDNFLKEVDEWFCKNTAQAEMIS